MKEAFSVTIEDKFGIQYFNKKRYYKYDLSPELMVLGDTIPYFFEYNGKRIYESAWNRLTVKILEMLDSINPLPNETLLALEYKWSKTVVFSETKRTNFLPFKDIFINTNHTATHAGMNIQLLLKTYGVDPADCIFYIRRHPVAEPAEAREYYRNQNIEAFRKCLELNGRSPKTIDVVIGNFNTINKFLAHGSTGFNDFFLFDDYYYFLNYKIKTLEYVKSHYQGTKYESATKTGLSLLDDFYKHRDFYLNISQINCNDEFKELIASEIDFLFSSLKSNIISVSKLYARMIMLYEEEMESLGTFNNVSDFYTLVEVLLHDKYFFNKPFISIDEDASLENDDIIMNYALTLSEFTSKILNEYIDKMHLKKLNNYVEFMENCSDYFVQIGVDKMIDKDKFQIDSYELERISKSIRYYINSFGIINTSTYSDYDSLPSMESEWNKYLLAGIVRTFLSSDFKVENTGGSFKTTDYIISLK